MKRTHTDRITPKAEGEDIPFDPVAASIAESLQEGRPDVLNLPNGWDRLALAIKQSDMDQKELADKIGVTTQTFSRWKKQNKLPESAIPFIMMAKYLNVSLDWLFYIDGFESSKPLSTEEEKILAAAEAILSSKTKRR